LVYLSVITGLVTALSWGTTDYMSRAHSERIGYYKAIIYSMLVTLIVLVPVTPLVSPHLVAPVLPLLALVIAGFLNFIGFTLPVPCLPYRRGVRGCAGGLHLPRGDHCVSIVVLKTFLSTVQTVAIAGIILGVSLSSTRFSELRQLLSGKGAPNLTAGFMPAATASLLFGTVYIGVGYAAPIVSVVIPVTVLRIVGISLGVILAPVLGQDASLSKAVFSKGIIVMGVLEAAGFLSLTYGISVPGGSLPVVTATSGMGGSGGGQLWPRVP